MISRHLFDTNKLSAVKHLDRYRRRIKKLLDALEAEATVVLGSARERPFSMCQLALLHSVDNRLIYNGLLYYIEMGIAHFQKVFTLESNLRVEIGKKYYRVSKIDNNYAAKFQDWIELFEATLLIRDKKLSDTLCGLKIWKPDSLVDIYDQKVAEYLKALYLQNEAERQAAYEGLMAIKNSDYALMNTMEGPIEITTGERSAWVRIHYVPLIEMYEYALQKEEQKFNQTLENYLLGKKAWILETDNADSSRFWIDFRALACCAFAYDNGVNITVESEYIPSYVYKGEYDKTFEDLSDTA